jgi:hypothetical protein
VSKEWLDFEEILKVVIRAEFPCQLGRKGVFSAFESLDFAFFVQAANIVSESVVVEKIYGSWNP